MDAVRKLRDGEQLVSPREVIDTIRLVARERRENREAQRMVEELTPREREVLQALAEGLGDKEFSVSVGTTRTHVANVLAKLEVQSRLAGARLRPAPRHREAGPVGPAWKRPEVAEGRGI